MVDTSGLILSNKTVLINGAKWTFKTHKQASDFYFKVLDSVRNNKRGEKHE